MASERTATSRPSSASEAHNYEAVKSLRHEDVAALKPPFAVTVTPPKSRKGAWNAGTHPALRRPATSPAEYEDKRDSGLASTMGANAGEKSVDMIEEEANLEKQGFMGKRRSSAPTTPRLEMVDSNEGIERERNGRISDTELEPPHTPTATSVPRSPSEGDFSPIMTSIPTESLIDTDFMDSMSFSKRGSMLLGGKKLVIPNPSPQPRLKRGRRQPSFSMLATTNGSNLSEELERESQKVRSMYEVGPGLDWQDGRWSVTGDRTLVGEDAVVEQTEPSAYVYLEPFGSIKLTDSKFHYKSQYH
jgi:hypothetical protein